MIPRSTWWHHHPSPSCYLLNSPLRPPHRPPPPNMVEPPIQVDSLPPPTLAQSWSNFKHSLHCLHAPAYTSNETLAHVQLGSTHFSHPDPRSQVDLNLRVDQLTQRMDDQNNLMRQLLNQIKLAQNLGLGQQGEERRMDEHADSQFDGTQAGRAGVSRQGDGQQRDQLADMSQASASHTQSR
ncbi:unnamed protein product, partial [Prunus brigantina]